MDPQLVVAPRNQLGLLSGLRSDPEIGTVDYGQVLKVRLAKAGEVATLGA